jgi:predicted aminopeptidase
LKYQFLRLLGFSLPPLLSGCYPLYASFGHLELMAKSQPVAKVVADSATSNELKIHLERVAAIREFASHELGLPDNGSYRSYVSLDQDYPAWNVWVTPELDLQPRLYCFPIVGCVPYRGYYSKQLADAYAEEFIETGDDVMVGGVTAYSTLGFFDDPITSTMLRLPEERLAGLIFHELAHQVVYVKNNATFNESFARAVEIEGTLRWLASRNEQGRLAHYQASLERARIFFATVKTARAQLAKLYASAEGEAEKRRGKKRIFESLRQAQRQRKALDPAWAKYDPWFADLNNAKLAAVATYFDDVSMFRELLKKANGDFNAFYKAVQLKAARLGQNKRVSSLTQSRRELPA